MPITLRINKKKHKIPKFDELTISQYKKVLDKVNDTKEEFNIINYISIVTGMKYNKTLDCSVDVPDFFIKELGEIVHDFNKIKPPKSLKIGEKEYFLKDHNISTFGHRFFMEQFINTNPSMIDTYVFIVSMLYCGEYDYAKIKDFMTYFDNMNYVDVLSTGCFFLNNSKNGEMKGFISLIKRMQSFLINIKTLKFKQG